MIDTIIKSVLGIVISGMCGYLVSMYKENKNQKEGLKCLLRGSMVNTYFAYKELGEMPYYCKQNWYYMYEAYKGLGGNSFIDDIKLEVDKFEVKK